MNISSVETKQHLWNYMEGDTLNKIWLYKYYTHNGCKTTMKLHTTETVMYKLKENYTLPAFPVVKSHEVGGQ